MSTRSFASGQTGGIGMTDIQTRLREFGTRTCPFDDPAHHQEQDDPCVVCGGLGTDNAADKCVGNMGILHGEAANEIARLTSEVEGKIGLLEVSSKRFGKMKTKADALAEAVRRYEIHLRSTMPPSTFNAIFKESKSLREMLAALTAYGGGHEQKS